MLRYLKRVVLRHAAAHTLLSSKFRPELLKNIVICCRDFILHLCLWHERRLRTDEFFVRFPDMMRVPIAC